MRKVIFEDRDIVPSKVVCVGRNYVEHIKELENEMPEDIILFIKPNSSITDKLIKPKEKCRYEGEISFIVENSNIVGVGFGIDLTLVNQQEKAKKKGLPWEKAKAFDNSAVFSEFVKFKDLNSLKMKLFINGKLKQEGDISLMIFKPEDILLKIKEFFTLEDGDIIMTGTPKGIGEFEVGDKFIGQIWEGDRLIVEAIWKVV
ncbi:MAG: fumarylacetoacetate hydrolase family protein [Hydrogenothermaceae bacterium]